VYHTQKLWLSEQLN